MGGKATVLVERPLSPPPSGKLRAARGAHNASSDPTLSSPLCQEILATEPWLSAAKRGSSSSSSSDVGRGGSIISSGGVTAMGGGSTGTGRKSDTVPGAKLWSAPVCSFVSRELQAQVEKEKDDAGRSLGSGDMVSEGGTPLRKGSIVACGGVRVTGGDVARMCGAAPSDLSAVPRARLVNPYSRNASHTYFMWNKALAAACDASPDPMIDDGPSLPTADYEGPLAAGARTFYVVTTQLLQFINDIVPRITVPFVVVTGSSDVSGPLEGMGWSDFTLQRVNSLLAQPNLVAVFSQNPDYKHPKVIPIHIGFDYHTIARPGLEDHENGHEWGTPESATAQDALLQHLRCTLPPFSRRPLAALMNFKSSGRSIRAAVHNTLVNRPGIVNLCCDAKIPRKELWRRYGEFSFIISPRGYGRDCHRTWEALALGSAVIVSRDSFMTPLYEDLPVVQISDWDEVTLENLGKWKAELSARWHTFRFEKLRTDFWLEAINAAAQQGHLEGIWKYNIDTREGRGNFSSGQLVWGRRGGTVDPPWEYWG